MKVESDNIDRIETHQIPEKTRRATAEVDAPYIESVERDLTDSIAGNLKNQDVVLMDLWQRSDGDEREYLRLLEEEAGEELRNGYRNAHKAVVKLYQYLDTLASNDELALLAEQMVNSRVVSDISHHGEVERLGLESLADHWNADEVLRTSTEIAAETGERDPETAGIDGVLMVDGETRTVQVKTGDGGDLQDCAADWLLRVFPETGNVQLEEI